MSPGFRRLLLVVGGLSLATTLCVVGIILWFQHEGMLVVQVHERNGDDVRICMPAAIADLAFTLAPGHCMQTAQCRLRDYRPLVNQVCRTMKESPDFTLVESRTSDEAVRVRKQGTDLLVEVQSPGEQVHLSIPVHLVNTILSRI